VAPGRSGDGAVGAVVRAGRAWTFGTEAAAPAAPGWGRAPSPPSITHVVVGAGGRARRSAIARSAAPRRRCRARRASCSHPARQKSRGVGGCASSVVEHGAERVPHLRRRAQNPHVVAVGEDLSLPSEHPVDRTGNPNGQRLKRPRERLAIRRLDDEMQMMLRDTEVAEPAPEGLPPGVERAADRAEQRRTSRAREPPHQSIRHMHGEARRERRPALVRNTRAAAPGLATGAGAPTTASPKRERELRRGTGIHDLSLVPNQIDFRREMIVVYPKRNPCEDTGGGLGNAPARRRRRRSLRSERPRPTRPAPPPRRRHLPTGPAPRPRRPPRSRRPQLAQ
jgi:hypothetical protein